MHVSEDEWHPSQPEPSSKKTAGSTNLTGRSRTNLKTTQVWFLFHSIVMSAAPGRAATDALMGAQCTQSWHFCVRRAAKLCVSGSGVTTHNLGSKTKNNIFCLHEKLQKSSVPDEKRQIWSRRSWHLVWSQGCASPSRLSSRTHLFVTNIFL